MLQEFLQKISSSPFSIRIKGKSLLYAVDLFGDVEKGTAYLKFEVGGVVRAGPLKSQGTFSSEYGLSGEEPFLMKHQIDFPKIKLKEFYEKKDDELIFQRNNKSPAAVLGDSFIEPLPLIFNLLLLNPKEDIDFQGQLLLGGKNRGYRFLKNKESFQLSLGQTPLFEGVLEKERVSIFVAKYKAKLYLYKSEKIAP